MGFITIFLNENTHKNHPHEKMKLPITVMQSQDSHKNLKSR